MEIRLPIRLGLVALATGVVAAVLVGRKPTEPAESEPARDSQAALAVETETDAWFI